MPRRRLKRFHQEMDDSNIEGYNYSVKKQDTQNQGEVTSPSMYQQALDGLKRLASGDLELTKLLNELATKERTLCENADLGIADALKNLAQRCRSLLGKYKEAETLGKRALEILEAAHGTDHLDVAEQLEALALSCEDLEKYEEAKHYYRRALAIYETKLKSDDLSIAQVKDSLALCYYQQRKYKEAKELYMQALEIFASKLHPNDFEVKWAKQLLDSCEYYIDEAEESIVH